jgi:hypothetical protein
MRCRLSRPTPACGTASSKVANHYDMVERLRYPSEPLPDDLLMVGPCSLSIHAALDQDDTNWIIISTRALATKRLYSSRRVIPSEQRTVRGKTARARSSISPW